MKALYDDCSYSYNTRIRRKSSYEFATSGYAPVSTSYENV